MEKQNGLLLNNHGNAIVLSLPLTIVVIAVIQLTMLQSSNFNSAITNFRAIGGRDSLAANIRMYSSLPATLRSSLHPSHSSSTNSELQTCVFGGLLPCNAGVETPLTLYSPMSSSSLTPSSPILIIAGPASSGGSSPQAALYDTKGNLCAETGAATERCPYEVTANFIATCAGGASSCATAQSIAIHYFIHYVQSSKGPKIPLRDFVDQIAPSVTVASILPQSKSSSDGNITVSSLTSTTGGSNSQLLSQITDAIKTAVPYIPDDDLALGAQAFLDAGYTDLAFISALAPILAQKDDAIDIITSLGSLGIKDLAVATMFAEAGIGDADWMKEILEAGITDPFYINMLYWHQLSFSSVTELKTAYDSVQGLPKDLLSLLVATTVPATTTAAQDLYKKLIAYTPDTEVAANLIGGNWYNDPAKSQAIVAAVAGLPSYSAGSMALIGITDPAMAQKIQSMVSVVDDEGRVREIIALSRGDLNAIQSGIDKYLAEVAATTTTKVTTTTNSSTTTTVSSPSGISLLSTCTTCSGVSF